jgi:TusA-related sulfurtransferase
MPIVLLAKALRDAGSGARLVVQADDRAFPEDVRAWCKKTGHELLSLDGKPGYYEAIIRKP